MKIKTLILVFTTGFSTILFAQEKKENGKIPLAVEKAFQKSYPNTKVKWEKEAGKYEAGFKQNGKKMSVLYSAAGIMEESEVEVPINQLPASVTQYTTQHKLGTIKEAAKITKADGSVLYEAEVKSGDALFDVKGNFVSLQKD
nr:PepSY-like domain-containing protein [uncultured Chryseobacterium sp.]